MSQIDQNTRGSEWRKWDLHVHTPFSIVNDFGDSSQDATWEAYIADLEKLPEEVKVLGINDYLFLDGYKKVLQFKQAGRLPNIDLILPVIEFRLKEFVGHDQMKRINYHILFADAAILKPEVIEQQFLNQLYGKAVLDDTTTGITWGGAVTQQSLSDLGKAIRDATPQDKKKDLVGGDLELGFNNINFSLEALEELLDNPAKENTYLRGLFLRAIGKSEWEAYRWTGSVAGKKTIINGCDFVFCASATADDANTAKKRLENQSVNSRLLHCSDAHALSTHATADLKIGRCYTWIKADTTFEGLKQVIYEPLERVRLQEANPSFEYDKPYFSDLVVENEVGIFEGATEQVYFSPTKLPLNKNLVGIIGGRGMGKSMLVDYWAQAFKNHRPDNSPYTTSAEFKLEYAKDNLTTPTTESYIGNQENYLDFIYIKQQRLKEVSKKTAIASEVKRLLKIEGLSFAQTLDTEIQETLGRIEALEEWFNFEDENGQRLNDKDFVESLKKRSFELLKSITTEKNKKKLATYTENINALRELESKVEAIDKMVEELNETQEAFNVEIAESNETFDVTKGFKQVPLVDFKLQTEALVHNKVKLMEQKEEKEKQNQTIKADFAKDGFTGDLSSLLENAKTYQSNIQWAEKQLEAIAKQETALQNTLTSRGKLGEKVKAEYERQKEEIDRAWTGILDNHATANKALIEKILLKEGKIVVQGEIEFNEESFYDKLLANVDRRTFRDKAALKAKFNIHSLEDWVKFISDHLKEYLEGENAERLTGIESVFFGLKDRGEYLRTVPKITYNRKPLEHLSVGQRGTVYLCLKLATDAFSKPIIFDQPEDDLDNEFIMNELIDIFKELKKYRQIIIVTHNANLVVNADAEQVVIAHNTDEKLSYTSGSLENPTIIENVCKILEGGKEAFERRKNRYIQ